MFECKCSLFSLSVKVSFSHHLLYIYTLTPPRAIHQLPNLVSSFYFIYALIIYFSYFPFNPIADTPWRSQRIYKITRLIVHNSSHFLLFCSSHLFVSSSSLFFNASAYILHQPIYADIIYIYVYTHLTHLLTYSTEAWMHTKYEKCKWQIPRCARWKWRSLYGWANKLIPLLQLRLR